MTEPSTPGRPTILVVDDNEANRALARETLEDEGYPVVVARSGEEGLCAFAEHRPACVVLDVRMPDLDGPSVCRRIRSTPEGADVPVIFLTALRDVETFDRALAAGGDDFLTKPVRPAELVVRIATALELWKLKAELRDQFSAFKKQRDDLQRVQLQKERLTSFLVHDLKSPVNAMDLQAQWLLGEESMSGEGKEAVRQIRAEAKRLNRMILDLLDVSQAEEGKLQAVRTPLSLTTLIAHVAQEFGPLAAERGVSLATEVDVDRVFADDDLVRRIVVNLVDNAVRHAPRASIVTVAARPATGGVDIVVTDRGAGVPETDRARIFEPFMQVVLHDAHRRGGRGLGLSFCKAAAEAHGGSIEVSDAAPGASFRVHLPENVA